MKISLIIADMQRMYDEYGDVEGEMADTLDMDMFQTITDVKFDQDRGRVQVISER
jgi:hypothetical protein